MTDSAVPGSTNAMVKFSLQRSVLQQQNLWIARGGLCGELMHWELLQVSRSLSLEGNQHPRNRN